MHTTVFIDKVRGSLEAGACGDALGYAVEFSSYSEIIQQFGVSGITGFTFDRGLISDDTQMTLFTAEGLLDSIASDKAASDDKILTSIQKAYLRWYETQTKKYTHSNIGLLSDPDLWAQRAPGNTCLSALGRIFNGQAVDNSSKGCGGIMRITPIAIVGATGAFDNLRTARLAGKAAFITHHHPLSTVSSAVLAVLIRSILISEDIPDSSAYKNLIKSSLDLVKEVFPGASYAFIQLTELLDKTFDTVESSLSDSEAVRTLGEGWTAEETLAIALASVMRHPHDLHAALIMAVNHSGDSDSTGAVAGNIIGAALGCGAIPEALAKNLELRSTIIDIADRLVGFSNHNHA